MNNKNTEKHTTFGYNIAIFITIILAALKLDGHLNIPWIVVIVPIIIDVAFGLIISLIVMLWLLLTKIKDALSYNTYNSTRAYGSAIHWDYKTQSFYDATGNKIDNTVENEEERDY